MKEPVFHPAVIEMQAANLATLRDSSQIVLKQVNWKVLPGEFWVVAGSQQSGKSNLLLHAAGLLTPVSGSCRVFGCETAGLGEAQLIERLRVGFVFADGKLFNQLTLAENIALPLRYHKNLSEAETVRMLEIYLELFELTPYAQLTPANVAANWRQRAALARALILQPELLLLDNPLAGLDRRHREWLVQFLDQLGRGHAAFGGRPLTLVVATGDVRAWQQPGRQFAFLAEKTFTVLGPWSEAAFARHHALKELLAESIGPAQ